MTLLQNTRPVFLLAFALLALPAQAERADRQKPIQIESKKITIDDAKKIQTLEGDVILTKGTLVIQAERVIITEDQYGFQKGTAFGSAGKLAKFRQKREGTEQYIQGEAERIEYNTNDEVAQLFHRAWVKSGEDQVRGDYIWYDSVSEKFLVSVGDIVTPNGSPARVHALIQPKNKTPSLPQTTPKKGDSLLLQGAQALGTTPQPGPSLDSPSEKK